VRAAIVLAAGASRRFGQADKLFAKLAGAPLVLHAMRSARAAPVGRVIVVASRPARIRALARAQGFRATVVVRTGKYGAPLSDTLRAGIAALRPIERDAFIFLGDMPRTDLAMPARLIRAGHGRAGIVRPLYRGTPGHPVLACRVRRIPIGQGDRGFRPDPARVRWIAGSAGCVADVDRRRDLRVLVRRARAAGRRGTDGAIAAGRARLYAAPSSREAV
jgi:molybdenum cofactor cytidylyltransferase